MAVDRNPKKDELLAGGADGVPKIYKMFRTQDRKIGDDFDLIRAFAASPGRIFDVTYNADGSRIAVGSSSDGQGEVRIYNTADGKQICGLREGRPIYAVAYREDGKMVAAGGFDGVVRLFDPQNGQLIKAFVPVPVTGSVAAK